MKTQFRHEPDGLIALYSHTSIRLNGSRCSHLIVVWLGNVPLDVRSCQNSIGFPYRSLPFIKEQNHLLSYCCIDFTSEPYLLPGWYSPSSAIRYCQLEMHYFLIFHHQRIPLSDYIIEMKQLERIWWAEHQLSQRSPRNMVTKFSAFRVCLDSTCVSQVSMSFSINPPPFLPSGRSVEQWYCLSLCLWPGWT